MSIQDLLGRTLVYGGLSLVLVAVDLAAVAGLTALIGDSLDPGQVVLVVLLLTVLLYGPLRQWLGSWARRLVLGDRDDPYDVVAGLATTLESADDAATQLAAVARAVASAFGVPFVSVDVDRGGGERVVATYGERPAETRTLPITYRGAEVGRLELPRRGLRSRLTGRDERLLGDLVRQAATAVRTSRLTDELQDSRERLVVAREEERRRIRRDLHDGLGPAMSGVVFQLDSARLLVDSDPGAAKSQLVETRSHVQDVVADVRRLVHDLRPPALDDLGLVGALSQQADRMRMSTRVLADDLDALPAAVEVAAFRIAGEAMTNVDRHAAATECTVRLRRDGDALLVEVTDDGAGIAPAAEAGVGLVALRERAAELGGRSEVTCPPTGGTVVRAWLPLEDEQEREDDMTSVRVVVVDDHQIVRDGLVALLGNLDDVEVVGSAADGRDAVHVVAEVEPDVVVMDIQMPQLDGIEATRFITGKHPGVRVVMLTMNEDDETILAALRAGASGYLLKGSGAEEVQTAIRAAAGGGMVFGAALAARVAGYFASVSTGPTAPEEPFPDLSERERTVLHLLAAGRSNDDIAAELYVSNKTVRNTVSSIYAKLHAAGRAEAIVKAREAGYGQG